MRLTLCQASSSNYSLKILFTQWRHIRQPWNFHKLRFGEVFADILLHISAGVLTDQVVAVAVLIQIVGKGVQADAAALDGFQAEQDVVDAAQAARCHKDEGQLAVGNVVDGEIATGERYHQTAGSFKQYRVVAFAQGVHGALDLVEVDVTTVDFGSQMRRTGISEDFGHGEPFVVLGQQTGAHQAAVQLDVFRQFGVAGLDKLLGDGADAAGVPLAGQETGGIALADAGVHAADKIYVLFHCSVCLCVDYFFRATR